MNNTLASLAVSFFLLLPPTLLFASTAWTPIIIDQQYVPGQILVKFKSGEAAAVRSQLAQPHGTKTMQTLGNQAELKLATLAPGQTVEQAVVLYNSDPDVEYAQPNYIYRALAAPVDPQYQQLWAARNTGQIITTGSYSPASGTPGNDMNLEAAWDILTDCSPVVVAVIDTGINYNSMDLAANMWMGNPNHGQNFASDGVPGDPMDLNGHGTHVAGIIGGAGNNGFAGAGVCWTAQLMAVRVLDAAGYGTTSSLIQGISFAVTNGARIINMSLGGNNFDQAYSDAITNAQSSNALFIVAAGNETTDNEVTPTWPCNFTHTNLVCVAALDQNYALARFSNWGMASVDVGAPGTNIYSTWAGDSNVITDNFASGWVGSSTTAGSGGGWAVNAGWLEDPKISWGTALYNANTDDRIYKAFNLTGVDAAILGENIAINVRTGDYLRINYKRTGGDPFVGGTNIFSITNVASRMRAPYLEVNITPCISALCTIGFQLSSTPTSNRDIGASMTNFSITTLTLNSTSTNTISGTSMATPEVAGVAALVWAYNPQYTAVNVANAIKHGGRSTTALSGKSTTGKAVDALGSLTYINPPTGIVVNVQ